MPESTLPRLWHPMSPKGPIAEMGLAFGRKSFATRTPTVGSVMTCDMMSRLHVWCKHTCRNFKVRARQHSQDSILQWQSFVKVTRQAAARAMLQMFIFVLLPFGKAGACTCPASCVTEALWLSYLDNVFSKNDVLEDPRTLAVCSIISW